MQYLNPIAYDNFIRPNATTSWGNASLGAVPWVRVVGTAKPSLSNNFGFLNYGGNAKDTIMLLGSGTSQNQEIMIKMRLGSNGSEQMGAILRYLDTNNYYKFSTGYSRNTSYLWSYKAGKYTTLLTMNTPCTVGQWVWVKIRLNGSLFSIKFWVDGTAEPTKFQWTKTDTALPSAGRYGVVAIPNSSSTGVSFSDVTVARLTTLRNATGRINFKTAYPTTRHATGRMKVIDKTARRNATGRLILGIAPLPQADGLYVTIGTTVVPIQLDTISVTERVNQRTVCSFSVTDQAIYALSQEQAIAVYVNRILLFSGYVESIETNRLMPSVTRLHAVTSKDQRYLADKVIFTSDDYNNWQGGDIVCDVIDNYLSKEGVTGAYAKRTDKDTATFSQGTLNGTDAATGNLTLQPSGTGVSLLESTTADFSSGTLTNMVATNDSLVPLSFSGIKMTGIAIGGANSGSSQPNIYNYMKIWGGSVSVVSGDYLDYHIWVHTDSPIICGGIDLVCSDGTTLRDQPSVDQFFIAAHPNASLQGHADDQWYHRKINMPSQLFGKTITTGLIALEGNDDGTYTFYVHDINIYNASGVLKQSITMSTVQQLSNVGYTKVKVTPVTVYRNNAVRISPLYDISGVGIVRNSFVGWDATTLTQTGGKGPYEEQVTIETSMNGGATWQACTNHAPIPNLIPGQTTVGRNALLRETLHIGGPDPTLPAILNDCAFAIQPSYVSPKQDVWVGETLGNMGTGTLTELTNDSTGLYMSGAYKNWDDADITTGQTLFGTGNPAISCTQGQLALRTDQSSDARMQFNFAGQHQNFVAEMDVNISVAGCEHGFVYRTTYWANPNDTYGYGVKITSTQIVLIKGANGPAAGWSPITTVSHTFTLGNWYRLKVAVFGNTHRVFMDDILYINATDSTYPATGYIGARIYNGATGRQSAFFDNFGVQDILSAVDYAAGSRVSSPVSLTPAGTVLDSYISWDADVPTNTSLDIQASIDNGVTYTSCTSDAQIPGILPQTNMVGKTLILKTLMNSNNPAATPVITGLGWKVMGQYASVGTRIAPPLDVSNAGRAGSSSISWDSDSPDGTSVSGATSLNGTNFTTTGSGNPVVDIALQPYPQEDDFDDADTNMEYLSTTYAGGTPGAVTRDTTLQTVTLAGGVDFLYIWGVVDALDCSIEATLYQSNTGALVARYRDSNNLNQLQVVDDNGGSRSPYLLLINRLNGVSTTYAAIPIDFIQGTYHTVKMVLTGTSQQVYWDGVVVATYTTNTILASGKAGFYNSSGTAVWTNLLVQEMGDDVTNTQVWSEMTLSSTDPTVTPVVRELSVTVRSPSIASGIQMSQTNYQYKSSIASIIDDVASQGNGWWKIGCKQNDLRQLSFLDRQTARAPWPLATVNDDILNAQPKVVHTSPKYRNRQYITGAIDHVVIPEIKVGDGITQSWSLTYPVDSISSIKINKVARTFGIKDKDTGVDFYYSIGSTTLAQDASAIPLGRGEEVQIVYQGQVPYTAMYEDAAQQKILADINGTSGIVEQTEEYNGQSKDAADALAKARITEYALLARDWTFSTMRPGLQAGQNLLVYVPEMSVPVGQFYILQVKSTYYQHVEDGSVWAIYDVTTTEGPDVGSWTKLFQTLS